MTIDSTHIMSSIISKPFHKNSIFALWGQPRCASQPWGSQSSTWQLGQRPKAQPPCPGLAGSSSLSSDKT